MKYEHIFEKIYRETHIVERRRKTTEEFIEEAKQIHPEYDYSKIKAVLFSTACIFRCLVKQTLLQVQVLSNL